MTNRAESDMRLPKEEDALYQSVLNGIQGEDGNYRMPPRGGNNRFTGAQVWLALEYKIAAATGTRPRVLAYPDDNRLAKRPWRQRSQARPAYPAFAAITGHYGMHLTC